MIQINKGFIELIKQTSFLYDAHVLIVSSAYRLKESIGPCAAFKEVELEDHLKHYVDQDFMDIVKKSRVESVKEKIDHAYFDQENQGWSVYIRTSELNGDFYLFFLPTEGVQFMGLIDEILKTQKLVNNPLKIKHSTESTHDRFKQERYFFNQVMDLIPNLVYLVDHKTMSNKYANRELTEILGYSIDEVQKMDNVLETLVLPEDYPSVLIHLGNIKSLRDNEVGLLEYRVIDSKRQVRWLCSRDVVFERDEKGEVTKHLGVATDITSMKEIKEIQKQLIDMNREMEEFTHLAAHDLKGPLASIESMVSILESSCEEFQHQNQELFLWLNKSIGTANKKIKNLTDIARIRFEPTLNYEFCGLESVLQEVLVPLNQEIQKHEITIKTNFDALSELVYSRSHLVSILFNLVSNSIKYRNTDLKTQIVVSTSIENGFNVITVQDNGLGIDLPRDEKKVFGLFKRAHLIGEGDGLGLYIIKKMIEKDGGELTVSSTLGKGSTFFVKLKK